MITIQKNYVHMFTCLFAALLLIFTACDRQDTAQDEYNGDDPVAAGEQIDPGRAAFDIGDTVHEMAIGCYFSDGGFYISTDDPHGEEEPLPEGFGYISINGDVLPDRVRLSVNINADDGMNTPLYIWGIGPWTEYLGEFENIDIDFEEGYGVIEGLFENNAYDGPVERGAQVRGVIRIRC